MNNPARNRYTAARVGASLLGCAFVALPLAIFASTNSDNGDLPASMSRAAASQTGKPAEMPSAEQLTSLLRSTLDRVDYSNKTGSYLGLYAVLTPQVQQKVDVQKLADAMSGFRKLNVDMTPVQKVAPQLDPLPQLSAEGLLTLRGSFPIQPRPIRFDLSYLRIDGDWRLQVLNLDAPPVQPVAAAGKTPPAQQPSPQTAGAAVDVAQTPAPPGAASGSAQGAPKPASSISPFLDTSTDPPTASKW